MTRQFLIHTVTTCFLVVAMCAGASADTVFFDDFRDGSVTNDVPLDRDGNPVVWVPFPVFPGTYDASSGDYFIETSEPGNPAATGVPDVVLGDVSIRARIRHFETSDPHDNIAILVRTNRDTLDAYVAAVSVRGGAVVGLAGDCCFGDTVFTDLRPAEEDILIQLDVMGNTLRFWAWRPGEPMPESPLKEVENSELSSGEVGLVYNSEIDSPGPDAVPGNGVARFVHVADMHIPEPSTIVLMGVLCLAMLSSAGRRSSRHS